LVPCAEHPWDNPVSFALHWKQKWLKFFNDYVLGHFAKQTGGVKEHSWVMEMQDRGSPHIHLVLWTEKTVSQLITDNVVVHTTWFPEGNSSRDPLMHEIVQKHQLHSCKNIN